MTLYNCGELLSPKYVQVEVRNYGEYDKQAKGVSWQSLETPL